MAQLTVSVVKDTTAPFVFRLKNGSSVVDLTGATVTLMLYDENQDPVSFTGTLVIADEDLGLVRFTPSAADFDNAPATLGFRIKVTLGGQVSFYPSLMDKALFVVSAT